MLVMWFRVAVDSGTSELVKLVMFLRCLRRTGPRLDPPGTGLCTEAYMSRYMSGGGY